jgi:hypothetical protein
MEHLRAADMLSGKAQRSAWSLLGSVFTTGGDPVKMGLVPSLSRPGLWVSDHHAYGTEHVSMSLPLSQLTRHSVMCGSASMYLHSILVNGPP